METTIGKWGNSWAVRIPNAMAKKLGLTESSQAELALKGEQLRINIAKKSKCSLEDIVHSFEAIGADQETNWGKSQGHEEW